MLRCFSIGCCLLFFTVTYSPVKKMSLTGLAQGTTYHITYYAADSTVVKSQVDSILNQIDSSLSLYKKYSLVSQFNNSSTGVIADTHFRIVIDKALETYRQTNGLFDITVYPLTDAWGFGPVKKNSIPDDHTIQGLLSCVDSRLLYWEKNKLMKKKPCVQLDPNGIAQGYAVDVIANFLEEKNIYDYLVELGGEIRIKGHKFPENKIMSIGIEAPNDDPLTSPVEKIIHIEEGAITTSGNYRRYYESNGHRISHLLDPRSGYPVQNELVSVSVYAKDAITADAYDNALMGMGLKKAMEFVESRNDLAAYFIYRRNDGSIADTMSRGFKAFLQ